MSAAPVIHIVNPMWNAFGGSEQRVIQLYTLLRPRAPVTIWSEQGPDKRLPAHVPVRRIEGNRHPVGGTLVVVGCYFPIGAWLSAAHPRRVVFVVNTGNDDIFRVNLDLVARTGKPTEIVYASEELQVLTGMPGRVEPSPIDIERFSPAPRAPDPARPFVVGRMSRDTAEKHHAEDPQLYAQLVERGCEVRVLGGTALADRGCPPAVRLLREGAAPPHEFLRGLDCFVYRTSSTWYETFGRVVFEAMACGLPVVAHSRGGYVGRVRHEENALLFETTAEAREQILRLRDDPGLRERLGQAARATVTGTYSKEYWSRLAEYYLAPG